MTAPIPVTLWSDAEAIGGAERYLEIVATGADRSRFRVRVVLTKAKPVDALALRLKAAGLAVTRVTPAPTLSRVAGLLATFFELLIHRPSVLHANMTDPRACNSVLLVARFLRIRRIAATEHLPDSPFDDKPAPFRHRVARRTTTRAIALTESGKQSLTDQGLHPERVSVIKNGLPDPGAPSPERREEARAKLWPGLADDVPILGYIGRLAEQKEPELLLEAAKLVTMLLPSARVALVGDGPERPQLERLAQSMGLAHAVRWLGWRDDAQALLYGCDCLILPSSYEGMPLVLIEAMAAGVPVVARQISGLDEVVDDGVTGYLVRTPPDAPRATIAALLAAAITKIFRDKLTGARFSVAARARYLEHFTDAHMLESTAAVWDDLLRAR